MLKRQQKQQRKLGPVKATEEGNDFCGAGNDVQPIHLQRKSSVWKYQDSC